MIPAPGHERWREIHEQQLVFVEQCWTTCESFCCTTKHPDLEFRVIRSDQTFLPMLATEYEYLRSIERLQPGMEQHHHTLSVNLDDGQTARLILARCAEKGLCFHPETRPFICKIYPFVPRVADDGTILDFLPGSIFDYVFHHLGRRSPCTVLEDRSAEVKPGLKAALESLCRLPYFIFYFAAFEAMTRQLQSGLVRAYPDPSAREPREFFRDFENLYLTGKLFDRPALTAELRQLHQRLRAHHGPFEV